MWPQAIARHELLDGIEHLAREQRLGQECAAAAPRCLDTIGEGAGAREHEHGDRRRGRAQLREQRVGVRRAIRRKGEIEQHDRRRALCAQRLAPPVGWRPCRSCTPREAGLRGDALAQLAVVVDDQDAQVVGGLGPPCALGSERFALQLAMDNGNQPRHRRVRAAGWGRPARARAGVPPRRRGGSRKSRPTRSASERCGAPRPAAARRGSAAVNARTARSITPTRSSAPARCFCQIARRASSGDPVAGFISSPLAPATASSVPSALDRASRRPPEQLGHLSGELRYIKWLCNDSHYREHAESARCPPAARVPSAGRSGASPSRESRAGARRRRYRPCRASPCRAGSRRTALRQARSMPSSPQDAVTIRHPPIAPSAIFAASRISAESSITRTLRVGAAVRVSAGEASAGVDIALHSSSTAAGVLMRGIRAEVLDMSFKYPKNG